MPKLFAWIASRIASVYRSLPLGPRMWMRSLLVQSPKRSFISLLVWQGMEFEEPSFILGRPVLAIPLVAIIRILWQEHIVSSGTAWDYKDILQGGEVGQSRDSTSDSIQGALFGHLKKKFFLSLEMPFRFVMSLQLAWRMASVYSLSSKTFGSIASRFCKGFLAPGHSPEL